MGAWFDTVTLTHSSRDGSRGRDGGKVEVEGRRRRDGGGSSVGGGGGERGRRGVKCQKRRERRQGRDRCWIILRKWSVVFGEEE